MAISGGDRWRQQWPVVAASALSIGVGVGLYQYLGSLFVEGLGAEYGWSRGEISTANALAFLGAASAPIIGRLTDRYGVAKVAPCCAFLVGLCYAGLASMNGAYWQYLLLMALIGCVAPGTTSLVYSRPVIQRFSRHRGLALGLVTSGLSLSALLLAPIVRQIIEVYGVDGGFAFLAALAFAFGVPAIALALRREPHVIAKADKSQPDDKVPSLLRNRLFWQLSAIMALVNIPATGLLSQLTPLLTDIGHPAAFAAILLSVFSAAVLTGRLLIGWLMDRLPARLIAGGITLFAAFGCLLLAGTDGMILTVAAVIAAGLMQGGESDILGYLVARHFAHERFSQVYGGIFTASLIASAVGVVGFGRMFDALGSYAPSLYLSAVLLAAATVGYYLLPRQPCSSVTASY